MEKEITNPTLSLRAYGAAIQTQVKSEMIEATWTAALHAHSDQVVAAARKWVGTPFKHQGRVLGVGCDCLGLLMGVAAQCALTTTAGQALTELDQPAYHIIADGILLEHMLDTHLMKVASLAPGSLVLLAFDNNPQHLGIISPMPMSLPASVAVQSQMITGSTWTALPSARSDDKIMEFNIIHADISIGKVVEHRFTTYNKIKKIYRLKEDIWHQ